MVAYGYQTSKMADSSKSTMMNSGEALQGSVVYSSLARKGATLVAYPSDYVAGQVGDPKSITIEFQLVQKECDEDC